VEQRSAGPEFSSWPRAPQAAGIQADARHSSLAVRAAACRRATSNAGASRPARDSRWRGATARNCARGRAKGDGLVIVNLLPGNGVLRVNCAGPHDRRPLLHQLPAAARHQVEIYGIQYPTRFRRSKPHEEAAADAAGASTSHPQEILQAD
uniref:Uncharacterized protein n=1 Tax=Aegilops tauschii subsp. strangulata TaxID=200361 RepID=A0A453LJW2_AEGTS